MSISFWGSISLLNANNLKTFPLFSFDPSQKFEFIGTPWGFGNV